MSNETKCDFTKPADGTCMKCESRTFMCRVCDRCAVCFDGQPDAPCGPLEPIELDAQGTADVFGALFSALIHKDDRPLARVLGNQMARRAQRVIAVTDSVAISKPADLAEFRRSLDEATELRRQLQEADEACAEFNTELENAHRMLDDEGIRRESPADPGTLSDRIGLLIQQYREKTQVKP